MNGVATCPDCPLPQKRYNIIYADPPWAYRDKALAGKRGAGCKYPTQSLEWICNLPIENIAANDAALFLWITMPHLSSAFAVISAWGFTYKTCAFTWVKTNKKAPTLFWGMGNYTRANAELCLLATRGKLKRVSARVHSIIQAPLREHSAKPTCTRERIVDLLGDIPRIEFFARERVPGWDGWGLEVDSKLNEYL